MNVAKYIIATNSWDGFGSFLRNSFIWNYTPEHDEFWRNIAKKGVDLWNK